MNTDVPSTDFSIRRARLDDLSDLVSLLGAAVPDCLPETVWQLPWTWHDYVVARDERGTLVAAGSLQRVDRRRAEIRGLTVAEGQRGRGLASPVIRTLMRIADRRGLDIVCVTRKPEFFARFGFHATPPDWLQVERRLSPVKAPERRVAMSALAPARSGRAA